MMFRIASFKRIATVAAAVLASSVAMADLAAAKVGNGTSSGSRGSRTYSAPPSTNTAPGTAAPMQKSITTPGAAQAAKPGATAAAATAAAAKPSMFGGMRGLLLGGLIGAGLASVFGAGMFANVLGFVLQAALIGGLAFLAYTWWQSRRGAVPAMAAARSGMGAAPQPQQANAYRMNASAAGGSALANPVIGPDDFNAFERLLGEIQLAYGRGDSRAISDRVTPEMLSYFSGDLATNAKKGVRNEITDPKLLQGDLSESWLENGGEYASVAMRFSLMDRMVDAKSGNIISGSATTPSESTEVWTFVRPVGGRPNQWELSAIQQA